jgi:DNA-binding response OmpR family regulator
MEQHKPLIFVIDEQSKLRDLIEYYLNRSDFSVLTFDSIQQLRQSIDYIHPNAIIINISTTENDGLIFCKQLKSDKSSEDIKIMMLTDSQNKKGIDRFFDFGADDFIEKPFHLNELYVRLSRLISLNSDQEKKATYFTDTASHHTPHYFRKKSKEKCYKIRNMTINLHNYEITIHNKKIALSFSEFQLLVFLIKKNGSPCSREEIIKQDGGDNFIITDRAVDVRIAGLRKKLGGYGKMIKTIRSIGYMFVET